MDEPGQNGAESGSSPGDELERQVRERIAELERANAALRAELAASAQAQEALRQSEGHWKAQYAEIAQIFEFAPVGLSVMDRDLRHSRVNRRLAEMNGRSVEGHVGYTVQEIAPGMVASIREATRPVFECGECVRDAEVHGWMPNSPTVVQDRLTNYNPLKSANGEVIGVIAAVQDITARKWAEEALGRSEAKYRALFESMSDAIVLLDERGVCAFNSATLRMFRCQPRDLLGKHAADFSPPMQPDGHDSRELADEQMRLATERGSHRFEWLHRRADGTEFPSDVWLTRMEVEGKPVLQAITRDISEQKQAAEELRASQQRFAALAAAAFEGIAITEQGLFVDFNDQFARMFGYERDELIGAHVSLTVSPVDRERVTQAILSRTERVTESEGVRADGSRILVEAQGRAAIYQGRPVRITVIRDITARKAAEKALRESETRFRSLVEFLPVAVMVVREGRIVFANAAAARLFGAARPDQLVGIRMVDQVPTDRKVEVAADMARLGHGGGDVPAHEGAILRLDQVRVEVDACATPFLHNGEPAVLVTLQDITGRKRDRESVEAHQVRLRELATELSLVQARERRDLADHLHDGIGQDLAVARLQLQMLRRYELPAGATELTGKARDLIERAIGHTRSLTLGLSPPALYEIGLEAALAGLVEEMRAMYGLRVEFAAPDGPSNLEEGPRVLVFRAVRELLLNVAKHAQAQHVSVAVGRAGGGLRAIVMDDGVGFDAAMTVPRTGFGLFSIREQIEGMGGVLQIESGPGKGTRVEIVLPGDVGRKPKSKDEHEDPNTRG